MKFLHVLALSAAACLGLGSSAAASDTVVTSIKPVHSLAAAVMDGVGAPVLLIDGASSPHRYNLRPSQAAALAEATLIFRIGPVLESFLDKPLETLGDEATVVDLMETAGLTLLPSREGGSFERHDHEDHEDHDAVGHLDTDEDHGTHGHGDDHDDEGEHAHETPDADHDDDVHHGHAGSDEHIWLDPLNAQILVTEIAAALSAADPANADRYIANAAVISARLNDLTAEIDTRLETVRDRTFIVFHDAYQYFEHRFGLTAAGSILVHPDAPPGAARVAEMQEKIRSLNAACVFSEPQFSPRIVQVVIEGSDAKSAVLDPLGAGIAAGPAHYFELMRSNAQALRDCLAVGS